MFIISEEPLTLNFYNLKAVVVIIFCAAAHFKVNSLLISHTAYAIYGISQKNYGTLLCSGTPVDHHCHKQILLKVIYSMPKENSIIKFFWWHFIQSSTGIKQNGNHVFCSLTFFDGIFLRNSHINVLHFNHSESIIRTENNSTTTIK